MLQTFTFLMGEEGGGEIIIQVKKEFLQSQTEKAFFLKPIIKF